jgi:hypothetical protein
VSYEDTLYQLQQDFAPFPIVSAFLSALEAGQDLHQAYQAVKKLRHTVDLSLVVCAYGRLKPLYALHKKATGGKAT